MFLACSTTNARNVIISSAMMACKRPGEPELSVANENLPHMRQDSTIRLCIQRKTGSSGVAAPGTRSYIARWGVTTVRTSPMPRAYLYCWQGLHLLSEAPCWNMKGTEGLTSGWGALTRSENKTLPRKRERSVPSHKQNKACSITWINRPIHLTRVTQCEPMSPAT